VTNSIAAVRPLGRCGPNDYCGIPGRFDLCAQRLAEFGEFTPLGRVHNPRTVEF
jgi:hypothetical protein